MHQYSLEDDIVYKRDRNKKQLENAIYNYGKMNNPKIPLFLKSWQSDGFV